MNTLLGRLVLYLNTCVKKDVIYEISCYIIKNYLDSDKLTLKDIMDNCFVSRASVTRFCEYFGFHTWTSFQDFLIKTKKIKEHQLESRLSNLEINHLYEHICYIAKIDTDEFKMDLANKIAQLVDIIYKSKRIYLFGAIYPLALATDFQINMITQGIEVYHDFQSENNEIEELINTDLAIVLTASGRYVGECRGKFNLICQSPAKKVILTTSKQYASLQYIDQYFRIPTSKENGFNDFDYYIILILDLVFIEYYFKYGRGNENEHDKV